MVCPIHIQQSAETYHAPFTWLGNIGFLGRVRAQVVEGPEQREW